MERSVPEMDSFSPIGGKISGSVIRLPLEVENSSPVTRQESTLMTATAPSHSKRRWLILGLIGLAQLMVVLDVTIVNIALPSAQKALGFSNDARQWIVPAYALSFGSLLLLGGRLGA